MRVKEFDGKIHENKTFVWFTHNLFPKTISGAGQKAEAYANLLKLCRTAYNMNSGGPLQADEPEAPVQAPLKPPDPYPEATHGTESPSVGIESAGDPT